MRGFLHMHTWIRNDSFLDILFFKERLGNIRYLIICLVVHELLPREFLSDSHLTSSPVTFCNQHSACEYELPAHFATAPFRSTILTLFSLPSFARDDLSHPIWACHYGCWLRIRIAPTASTKTRNQISRI